MKSPIVKWLLLGVGIAVLWSWALLLAPHPVAGTQTPQSTFRLLLLAMRHRDSKAIDELTTANGKQNLAEVASDLELNDSALRHWLRAKKEPGFPRPNPGSVWQFWATSFDPKKASWSTEGDAGGAIVAMESADDAVEMVFQKTPDGWKMSMVATPPF